MGLSLGTLQRRNGVACLVAGIVAACGSVPPISRIEDKARLDVPIAICRKPMAPGDLSDAGVARTDAYWGVALSNFRGFGGAMRPDDLDCVGEPLAGPAANLTAAPVTQDDLVLSSAEDGLSAVWLRSFRRSEDLAAGPLALVRVRPSEIDVYAIGRFQGSLRHSRFELAELGTSQMIVAHDEGCADVKVDVECDSALVFFVAAGGKLLAAATSPAQKIRYGNAKGLGRVQFRLTTDAPVLDGRTVRVHEKLQVRDSAQEDVRKAEGDRVFVLGADGRLVADQESLWSQVTAAPEK
jgi:hypothetical protein